MMNTEKNKNLIAETVRAAMFGLAIADALGVPVEFRDREELRENPVRDYRGYGSHPVPAGTWSDDTSMALATLDSLSHGLDYEDIMRRFCDWRDHAAYTATDEVFDIGITTNRALSAFCMGTPALECGQGGEYDNGNGSLMRIIPATLYCQYAAPELSEPEQFAIIHAVSALTHSHPRSEMACGIYACVLRELLADRRKESIQTGLRKACAYYESDTTFAGELIHFQRLFKKPIADFAQIPEQEIQSSGYVVATLEAAIWCVLNTGSYEECVLKAVNLGRDTDTVGAVAGGLAGCLYGMDGIPKRWYDDLRKKEMLEDLCEAFVRSIE